MTEVANGFAEGFLLLAAFACIGLLVLSVIGYLRNL